MYHYKESMEAFHKLTKKDLIEEERSKLLEYIFREPEAALRFIKSKLYRDINEFNMAVEEVLNNYKYSGFLIMAAGNELSESQYNMALRQALKHWDTAYQLISEYKLNVEQRKEAISSILLSTILTKKLIAQIKITPEEVLYILDHIKYSGQLVYSIFKHCSKNGEDRIKAFEILLNFPDEIYILAIEKKLSQLELKQLYDLHGSYYYKKFQRDADKYYEYCKIFNKLICNIQRDKLVQKALLRENHYLIYSIVKNISINKAQKEKLNSLLVINKLAR